MKNSLAITRCQSREILDSRGFPTVEVDLTLSDGSMGRALVPSGASTGEGEALELRDGDPKRFKGKGVLKAVANVNQTLAPLVTGKTYATLDELDTALLAADGTPNKAKLGANAILGVSMAFMRAVSAAQKTSTFRLIASTYGSEGVTLPVPLMNLVNGGKHADNGLDIQEFMIVPHGFTRFSDALRAGAEVFHTLKKLLHDQNLSTGVGDEGGFAPTIPGNTHESVLKFLMSAIEGAGYTPGKQISLALDCAASEFSKKGTSGYTYNFEGKPVSSSQMIDLYADWVSKYPIVSIEDGLAEHDWEGFSEMTKRLGEKIQLVGDDLFVTNVEFLKKGIELKIANSILIKVNQIGTVSETLKTMKLAKSAGYTQVSSHRSGETEDTFIADLAVGTDCGQIKTGSASRTDRIAKYNQLIRIEEELGAKARFAGSAVFKLR